MPRQKRPIDACPHTDRTHYARGMCQSCYRAARVERQKIDQSYEASPKGKERKARYEATEKARGRKREWARIMRQRQKKLDTL